MHNIPEIAKKELTKLFYQVLTKFAYGFIKKFSII